MAKVMEPHVLEPGLAANQLLRRVQIDEPRAGPAPEGDPGVARLAGHGGEHLSRRRRQRDGARPGLRVAQPELVVFEVDVLPLEGEDFAAPAAGEHQQAQRRRRARRHPAGAFESVEHDAEPIVIRLRQEPLAASRRLLFDEPAGVAAGRPFACGRRPLEEPRQHGDRVVRYDRRGVEAVVQHRALVGRDLAERRCRWTPLRYEAAGGGLRGLSCGLGCAVIGSWRWWWRLVVDG